MAFLEDLAAAKERLCAIAGVITRTHNALIQAVYHPALRPTPGRQRCLSETLEHIADVREGFILSQRALPRSCTSELGRLMSQVVLDWGWFEAMGISTEPGGEVEHVGDQVVCYTHALVALGMLPRLPAEAVTFPQPCPTYIDVEVPEVTVEMLDRIEEMEQVLYRATCVPLDELAFNAVRRTYAFFEASAWVINRYCLFVLTD